MLDKLEQIEARYETLTGELSSPEVYSDPANYAKLNKQHRGLGEVVTKYREWKQLKEELTGAKELFDLADDEEMRELARSETATLEERLEKVEEDLRVLLLPRDPNDEKNVILEIRAGTGGEERRLVAAGAGAYFEDDVLLVVRVAREQEDAQVFLDLPEPPFECGHLGARHLAHL